MKNDATRSDRDAGLRSFLEPASVAIIGASDDPSRIGGRPLRYMREGGYEGPIYPVNPKHETIQGLPAYPTIREVPGPVDCAIIAVHAKIVASTVEDCAAMGVKSAVVFSSGFAEMGGDGVALQEGLSNIARRTGIRIVGPNCLGVLSIDVGFYATFSSTLDAGFSAPGQLAIISQSGAYGTHLFGVARNMGLGARYVITTGNECDVDVAECIGWAAEADEVEVIAAYAEGVRDGPALMRGLAKARANGKPVIFMKVGRTEEGAAAAASHTASLAGSDAIYDAVFRQYGVHRAETTEGMLDIAYACTAGVYPGGNKIGLVTLSGGVGVQMADFANKHGLDVAPMPASAQAELKKVLPYASARNPVDITAQAFNDMSLVGKNFSLMLEDGGYDVVVAFFTIVAASPYIVDGLVAELDALRRRFPDRLIFLSLVGPDEIVDRYRQAGYLTFEDPCRAIAAVSALVGFGASFAGPSPRAPTTDIAVPATDESATSLSEWDSRTILAEAGVPVAAARLATSAAEAEAAAAEFASPLAMKINGQGIGHKTEIGGVVLDVAGPAEARLAYDELVQRVARAAPDARLDGVIVAPMIRGGIETILGVQIDPVFGPAVMFGLGGVFVEVLEDVSFRIAPFGRDEALAMIFETKGAKILEGVRGRLPADIDALVDALIALSDFAADEARAIASVDLNPFMVLEKGQGAVALDCLVVQHGAGNRE